MYWMGGYIGFHLGHCALSKSQSCQHYFDVIGGVGGRDGLTTGLLLSGLRWQFVSFPKPFSPSIRLLAGVMNIRDDDRDKEVFAYGLSYGLTTAIHERIDLKFEVRTGYADAFWAQSFVSASLKLDKWVDYFAQRLKQLGKSTVKTSGQIIEGTIEAPGRMIRWLGPSKESQPEQKKPAPRGNGAGGNQ